MIYSTLTASLNKTNVFIFFTCLLLFCLSLNPAQAQLFTPKHADLHLVNEEEDLNVLKNWIIWNDPGNQLISHLVGKAQTYYSKRDSIVRQLKSREDWQARQKWVKERLLKLLGPFPEKTKLNPQITGTILQEGYRIEKIILESRPQFYVTGLLFIPDHIQEKTPAVLNLIGHEQESFRAELDQLVMVNLVKKGIIVMTIDPPGQGENVQYYDPEIEFSSIGYSVIEHCYFGNQCFLAGSSSAKYFVWDAVRAIDYLVSRKEVDPGRIGVTGFSGGGTITTYVSAIDDRVLVSVPSSWSTASRRQLESKGAQDAEAELYHGLKEGITLEDLLEVRAPKPTLLTFVSRDQYLTLQAARDCFGEVQGAYKSLGASGNIEIVEDDSRHWLTPKIRWSIYDFFLRYFNLPNDANEDEISLIPKEDLFATVTGQLSTSRKGKMIFDIQKQEAEKLLIRLNYSRENDEKHLQNIIRNARELSGYEYAGDGPVFITGRYQRDGYHLTKMALQGTGEYMIPMLLFTPGEDGGQLPAIVYLCPEGKTWGAEAGGEIEQLVRNGYVVLAIDVPGTGELRNTTTRSLAPAYTGVLLGESIVGLQASDINRAVRYLIKSENIAGDKITALAFGELCIPLLHAAAFEKEINTTILIHPLISYESIAMNRHYKIGLTPNPGGGTGHPYEVDFNWGVPGALTAYDLPDLAGNIAPRKLILAGVVDQMREPASISQVEKEYEYTIRVYDSSNARENVIFSQTTSLEEIMTFLPESHE